MQKQLKPVIQVLSNKHFFSVKGQIVNIFAFVDHMVSVAKTQLSCARATINLMQWVCCVPIKLYLQQQADGQIQLPGCSLQDPELHGDEQPLRLSNDSFSKG